MREYSVKHRDLVTLVFLGDKHKVKCGEPSYLVASAERGKKIIVAEKQIMAVGDHHFTKFTLILSVDFLVNLSFQEEVT